MKIPQKICTAGLLTALLTTSLLSAAFFPDAAKAKNGAEENFDRKRNQILGYTLGKRLPALHYSRRRLDDTSSEAAFDLYLKQLDYQKRFLLQSDVEQLNAFSDDIDNELLKGSIILPDAGHDILSRRIDVVEKMVKRMLADDKVVGLTPEAGTVEQEKKDSSRTYTVAKGDTLGGIAGKFPTVSLSELLALNKLSKDTPISVGKILKIPPPKRIPQQLTVGIFDMLAKETLETEVKNLHFAKTEAELEKRWHTILKMQIIANYLDRVKDRKTAREEGKPGKDNIARKNDITLWQDAVAKILKRNTAFFNRLRQETRQDHYDRFFGAVTRAFDPHTSYVPPASKEEFDIDMRGSLEGIGAMLREEDGIIKVVSIVPGSASAKTGKLKAEDIIMEVQQEGEDPVDITAMRLRDAVRLIRGPKGSTVTLTVKKPDGSTVVIPIVRDVVQLEETFVKYAVVEGKDDSGKKNGDKIGYIYIPSFYRDFDAERAGKEARNSTDDTREAIEKLKEQYVKGIILDLRDDGGGALYDAVDITGLFIENGPVVAVRNSLGDIKTLEDSVSSVSYAGPLVVLVNKFSASASEIVAAALQDYGRAVIVGGAHTHGKGTVQTIVDLNDSLPFLSLRKYEDLGALKITAQKFYRINGKSTQWKGVEPDIVLPSLFEHIESGERYLDYSLPWDSIEVAASSSWPEKLTVEQISAIKKRSEKRVAKSKKFAEIRSEAAKALARSKETVVAVDLAEMTKKRKEADTSQERVDELYNKHGLTDEEDNKDGMEPTKEEKRKKWLEEIDKDPYIREGIHIIEDIRRLQNK